MSKDRYLPDERVIGERITDLEQKLDHLNLFLATMVEVYSEPSKPRNGVFVFADGTTWDPGSGRGLYIYNGNTSAWVQWLALP